MKNLLLIFLAILFVTPSVYGQGECTVLASKQKDQELTSGVNKEVICAETRLALREEYSQDASEVDLTLTVINRGTYGVGFRLDSSLHEGVVSLIWYPGDSYVVINE